MKESGVRVLRERFTHGTSAQRVYWFTEKIQSIYINRCTGIFRLSYKELWARPGRKQATRSP